MNWLFIHIPRTGGSTVREQIGMGAALSKVEHLPLAAYEVSVAAAFTIVRNPYDRAVSLAAIRQPNRYHDVMSLAFFTAWVEGGFEHQVMSIDTKWSISVAAPQSSFFLPDDGYVGRFENYQGALKRIAEITGIQLKDASYRAGGRTHHLPWQEYYRKPEIQDAVLAKYAQDFAQFAYPTTIH